MIGINVRAIPCAFWLVILFTSAAYGGAPYQALWLHPNLPTSCERTIETGDARWFVYLGHDHFSTRTNPSSTYATLSQVSVCDLPFYLAYDVFESDVLWISNVQSRESFGDCSELPQVSSEVGGSWFPTRREILYQRVSDCTDVVLGSSMCRIFMPLSVSETLDPALWRSSGAVCVKKSGDKLTNLFPDAFVVVGEIEESLADTARVTLMINSSFRYQSSNQNARIGIYQTDLPVKRLT